MRKALVLVAVAMLSIGAADTPKIKSLRTELSKSFLGVDLSNLSKYPSCDSPEGAAKICVYRDEADPIIELRPERPKWIKTNIYTGSAGGKIVTAWMSTQGIVVQADAFADLKLRYGTPTNLRFTVAQNAFGASFRIIHATWKTSGGAIVAFDGAKDTLDEGVLKWLG